jgi:hypothetical protein
MDASNSSSSSYPQSSHLPSATSSQVLRLPTDRIGAVLARRGETICGTCRHVPPHRMALPTYCAPMALPADVKKEEQDEGEDDDIIVVQIRGKEGYQEAATRAHLLKRPRARSLPPHVSSDQKQQSTVSLKRSRAVSPTSTRASPPRPPAVPFAPALLSSYRLRISLEPVGPGSEDYASPVTSLDLAPLAAVAVVPLVQQQQQQGFRVRRDLFEETSSAPASVQADEEVDGEEGGHSAL